MRTTTLWIVLILLALPLACSQAEDKAEEAAAAASEAVDAAATSAQEAADAAAEKAAQAAAEAKQAASSAAAATGAAAAELTGDPVAKCSELAAQGSWSEALDVCKKAHEADPDNMAIEHALQQAQAAAE